MSAIILEAGNVLTLTGTPPSDRVNVANGTLIYGANQTDNSLNYLLGAGGHTEIAAGVTLTSNYCSLNSVAIPDNTVGEGYYIETVGAGGAWVVTYSGGTPESPDPGDTASGIIISTILQALNFRR